MSSLRSKLCISVEENTIRNYTNVYDGKHAENADMHYMCGQANGNGRDALRINHAQVPDQQMLDHRIFQRLHPQPREIRLFHVTRHDIGR
ncbi:hypothetical protein TNCV_920251 [Trichonephila clavipes]|nr:hypothetical protein TNCV_920251 [Trichonephila clavipes]